MVQEVSVGSIVGLSEKFFFYWIFVDGRAEFGCLSGFVAAFRVKAVICQDTYSTLNSRME